MGDKNNNKEYNKGNKGSFTTQELENDKKDKKVIDSNISTIGKPLTNIMYVEENPERDKNTMRKQDTIRDIITKEFPLTVETTNFHEEECNEINNTAVESRKPIMETPTLEMIFSKNREIEGTLEYYRKLIKEKDKINQITEESLWNNRNILQKSERTN